MGPPVEEGMCFDLILIVGEDTAALGKNFIEFIEGLEVLIDDGLVRQRPQAFGGLDLWRVWGQEHQFNAFWNLQIPGDMPARAVQHQDDVFVHAGTNLGGERRQEPGHSGEAHVFPIQDNNLTAELPLRRSILQSTLRQKYRSTSKHNPQRDGDPEKGLYRLHPIALRQY